MRPNVSVGACGGLRDKKRRRKEARGGKDGEAEELHNAARIHTELFWPAYLQPGRPAP